MAGLLFSLFFLLTVSNVRSPGMSYTRFCPNIASGLTDCINQYLASSPYLSSHYTSIFNLDLSNISASTSVLSRLCNINARSVLGDFYDCYSGKVLACIPQRWHKVYPSLKTMRSYMLFVCRRFMDVDFSCLNSLDNIRRLNNCTLGLGAGETGDTSSPDDVASAACRAVTIGIDCVRPSYTSCPENTLDYLEKSYDYQRPEGCGACMARPSLIGVLVSVFSILGVHSSLKLF